MPVSKARGEYIRALVDDKGIEWAMQETGLKRESIRRMMRYGKAGDAPPAPPADDLLIDKTLAKLSEVYSPAELRALLKDKAQHHDNHRHTRYDFSGEWIKFGVISDLHIGSAYTDEHEVEMAIAECARQGCEMLLISGDVTEGMSGRDGHIYELKHVGYKAQRAAAVRILSRFPGKIKAISGNHDLWYMSKGNQGALIVEDICHDLGDRAEYLGEHEGSIYLNGARVDLWHGEDGASYALSYRLQKIVESIEGGTKPNMIITGHDHKSMYLPNLRNIQAIAAGCMQHQTPWMRHKKLAAYCGFWIVELCIRDGKIIKVRPEWTMLYFPDSDLDERGLE